MDDQTKKLLKECNVGCKMALQSMTQVEDYLEDSPCDSETQGKHMKKSIRERTGRLASFIGNVPGGPFLFMSWTSEPAA